MASKSKSKGTPKKASPASKPSKASKAKAPAAKPTARPVAAKKAPNRQQPKVAPKKPAPTTGKRAQVVAKGAGKPGKLPAPKTKLPSGKAKVAAKSPKKGTPIKSTKALKTVPARPMAKAPVKSAVKAAAKTPLKKTAVAAKPISPARKAPAKATPARVVASKKGDSRKAPSPAAKPLVLPPKAAPKTAEKPVKPARVVAPPAPVKSTKAQTQPEKESRRSKPDLFVGTFFQEVPVGSAAVRKSRVPQVPVVPLRKPKGEESHDELIARIEKELLTVRMAGKKVHRVQVCTKCCINPVDPSFMVDRDTGYCTECALVLGLGHTREARQQNFHPSLMKSENAEVPEPT
jgi:hypothetical protein